MRTINVKVLRDYESDNLRLEEGQIIEIISEFCAIELSSFSDINKNNFS